MEFLNTMMSFIGKKLDQSEEFDVIAVADPGKMKGGVQTNERE